MTAPAPREWAVTYKARPSAAVILWAVITEVPRGATRSEVEAALEAWSRWPQFQAQTRPGSVITVRPRRTTDDAAVFSVLEWGALAPEERKVQVTVPGTVHASLMRQARAAGVSLTALVSGLLVNAADVEVPAPAPVFADEPLPLGDES